MSPMPDEVEKLKALISFALVTVDPDCADTLFFLRAVSGGEFGPDLRAVKKQKPLATAASRPLVGRRTTRPPPTREILPLYDRK